jgi:1,4-dihydroxy-2-naphthoyl-CoA hydrolase
MDWIAVFRQHAAGMLPGLLGVRFLEATADGLRAELPVRDDLCTMPGVMHGGALMAFADTLGACATVMRLPAGAGTTTIESKTNFLAGAAAGTTITGEATVLHAGRRTVVCQTRVTNAAGRLLAVVTQTQAVLEPTAEPTEAIGRLFEGKSPEEQRALLATLERGGAALYRSWAAAETDPGRRKKLLAAADREVENAALLEGW